jgi:hypothetical protein
MELHCSARRSGAVIWTGRLTRGQRYRFNARSIAAGFVGSVAVTSSLTPSCTPEKADNVDCGTYLQDIDGECFGAPAYGEAGCEDCCGGDAEAPPDVGASDVRVDAADADIVDAASGDALVPRGRGLAEGYDAPHDFGRYVQRKGALFWALNHMRKS